MKCNYIRSKSSSKSEMKKCPFCGCTVTMRKGLYNIHFFDCANPKCGACVSFKEKGTFERDNPIENWNKRAGESK